MSHRDHSHVVPLRRRSLSGRIPGNQFGALVGSFDHATLSPHDGTRPDDNHVYLWLSVATGEYAGRYEAAVNIHSTDGSDLQFAETEENVPAADLPSIGFAPAKLSYAALGLAQADFRQQTEEELHVALLNLAQNAERIAVYGHTYGGGDGLHDVHMNSGEPPSSGHPNPSNQDGALIFYRKDGDGAIAHWLFLKFASQSL